MVAEGTHPPIEVQKPHPLESEPIHFSDETLKASATVSQTLQEHGVPNGKVNNPLGTREEDIKKRDPLRDFIIKRKLKSDKTWNERRRRRELDSKPNVKATEDALLRVYDSLDPGVVKKTVALLSKPVIVRSEVGDHVAQIGDIAWGLAQFVIASGIRVGGPIGRYSTDGNNRRVLQIIGGVQFREKFNSRHVLYGMIRPFGIARWADTKLLKVITDIASKSKIVHDVAHKVDESTIGKRVEHVLDRFAKGGLFLQRNKKPEDIPSKPTAEKSPLGDNQVFEASAKST